MKNRKKVKIWTEIVVGLVLVFSLFILISDQMGIWDRYLEAAAAAQREEVLGLENGEWKYLNGQEEPESGRLWSSIWYDDSKWLLGTGIFADESYAEADAVLNPGSRENPGGTCFFRKTFLADMTSPDQILSGMLYYQGGIVIYLNGTPVFSGNIPEGGYQSNLEAGSAETDKGIRVSQLEITDLSALRDGKNVLAVELHRESYQTSELYFHLEGLTLKTSEEEEENIGTDGLIIEQGSSETEVRINWMTDKTGSYQVEYADVWSDLQIKESDNFPEDWAKRVPMSETQIENREWYLNKAVLSRLKPGARYVFRITGTGNNDTSEVMEFTVPGPKRFSSLVLGDPQLGSYGQDDRTLWSASLEAAEQWIPKADMVIVLGDQVDGVGSEEQVLETFWYYRTPRQLKERPWIMIRGNHEAAGSAEKFFNQQFLETGKKEGEDSFLTCQDTLILKLDSNNTDMEYHQQFIAETVKEHPRKWNIVLMHHSPYSQGTHREDENIKHMREELGPLFEEVNIDLVLSGHDHIYSRTTPQGGNTVYVTMGSSTGNKFYEKTKNEQNQIVYQEEKPVAGYLEIDNSRICLTVYELEKGTIIDKVEIKSR